MIAAIHHLLFLYRSALILGLGVLVAACSPEKEVSNQGGQGTHSLSSPKRVFEKGRDKKMSDSSVSQAKKDYQILDQFIEKTNRDLNDKKSTDLESINSLLKEKIEGAQSLNLQDPMVDQLRALEIQYLSVNYALNETFNKTHAATIEQKSREIEALLDRFSNLRQTFKAKYQVH